MLSLKGVGVLSGCGEWGCWAVCASAAAAAQLCSAQAAEGGHIHRFSLPLSIFSFRLIISSVPVAGPAKCPPDQDFTGRSWTRLCGRFRSDTRTWRRWAPEPTALCGECLCAPVDAGRVEGRGCTATPFTVHSVTMHQHSDAFLSTVWGGCCCWWTVWGVVFVIVSIIIITCVLFSRSKSIWLCSLKHFLFQETANVTCMFPYQYLKISSSVLLSATQLFLAHSSLTADAVCVKGNQRMRQHQQRNFPNTPHPPHTYTYTHTGTQCVEEL